MKGGLYLTGHVTENANPNSYFDSLNEENSAFSDTSEWYVVRTKQHRELSVKKRSATLVDDVYLPLLRIKRRHRGKLSEKTEPLFPGYLFARFSLGRAYQRLKYTPGVTGVVCAGDSPCELKPSIIEEIKSRETNGLIVVDEQRLQPRQRVQIMEDPFCGIEAIFERYLSGAERITVLLNSVGQGNLRAVLRASAIAPADFRRVG
jgi:transcriptional antiterminator RfaH